MKIRTLLHSSAIAASLFAFGFAGELRAQNAILLNATSLNFTAQVGGPATAAQTFQASSSNAQITVTAAPDSSWLTVAPPSGTTPVTFSVTANPGSMAAGTYNGNIVVSSPGATNSPLNVKVTLTVSSTAQLTVNPSSLAFTYQTGTQFPPSQTISIGATSPGTNFTATPSANAPWLLVQPTSGTTPGTVTVSVNPTGLAAQPAPYSGQISIAIPGNPSSAFLVPVTLTVTANPTLNITPGSLAFFAQIGAGAPPMQNLSFASSAGAGSNLTFTLTRSTNTGGQWLVVAPLSGSTPSNVAAGIDAGVLAGLAAGTYTGSISVSAPGAGNPSQTVPVTLTVSTSPLLITNPTSVSFSYQSGGATPATQAIALTSTGPALPYTVTISTDTGGAGWLTVDKTSGSTPDTLNIGVSPAGLSAGTYTGSVAIAAAAAGNTPQTIRVTLTVSTSTLLSVVPGAMSFAFQTGSSNPANQILTVNSTGAPLNVTVAAAVTTPSGGSWLSVSPLSGTTPAQFTISVNPAGLAVGSYMGTITVTAAGAANSPIAIPVTLVVSNTPLLVVSPSALNFSAPVNGANPAVQTISVASTGASLSYTVSFQTSPAGASWLAVAPTSGATPGNLSAFINTAGLAVGTYNGSIVITSTGTGNSPQTVPVTLTITPLAMLNVTPATLTFSQAFGGAQPASQNISVASSAGALTFQATATTTLGGSWLSVTPNSGTTPGTLMVTANGAGLSQGTYPGQITIASSGASNSPQTVNVTLTVGPAQTISVSPATLSFTSQIGGAAPATQTFAISGNGAALPFSATVVTASGGSWLSVSPATGTTPANVTVTVTPTNLTAGSYTGTISVASPTAGNSPQTVTVNLTVQPMAPPVILAIKNAASFLPTAAAPGLILTLGGTNIGPSTLTTLQLTTSGTVATSLGGTRVLFDGIPSPLIYVSSTQTSVIVPYEIAGRALTNVQVEFNGVLSNTVQLQVVDAAPGIFSLASNGAGQGAILNQDGKVNGPTAPAPKSTVVSIYATGEGQTNPGGVTGSVTKNATTFPVGDVKVTIGGQPAQVQYAGEAPGLVAGVLQVNAVIPDAAGSGPQDVIIIVNGHSSQPNLKVTVQ